MGRLTTHVLDTASGVPAHGMRVELHDLAESSAAALAEFRTSADGRGPTALLGVDAVRVGRYELRFHVAEYFRARGVPLPDPPFLDVVVIHFGIADAAQHYH